MLWLKTKIPWLSLILLVATYCVFGWYIAQLSVIWSQWLAEQGEGLGWGIKQELYTGILYVLSGGVILLVTFGLTAPVALITFFMGSPLKTDVRAMFSVLAWSFAVVIIVCWLEYFIHFLVLVCSAILARLGLQELNYSNRLIYLILSLISLCSFSLGIFLYVKFG